MEQKCKFSYNEIDDSLIISRNDQSQQTKEKFMFDDIIFYLTENGKIIGLQIRNVYSVLSESDLNYNILDNITKPSVFNPRLKAWVCQTKSILQN